MSKSNKLICSNLKWLEIVYFWFGFVIFLPSRQAMPVMVCFGPCIWSWTLKLLLYFWYTKLYMMLAFRNRNQKGNFYFVVSIVFLTFMGLDEGIKGAISGGCFSEVVTQKCGIGRLIRIERESKRLEFQKYNSFLLCGKVFIKLPGSNFISIPSGAFIFLRFLFRPYLLSFFSFQ